MSYVRELRHTEEEYEKYAPREYRRFGAFSKVPLLTFVAGLVYAALIIAFVPNKDHTNGSDESWFTYIMIWSAGFAVFIVPTVAITAHQVMSYNLDSLVDNAIMKEGTALQTTVVKMQKDMKSMAARIKDIKATGHVVMAGAGATVVISSDISNAFNSIKNNDPGLADALQTITGAVEKSNNKNAGETWTRFMKQATGERDKTILSALWDRVVKLVPEVTSLVESVAKISSLFT